MKFCPKKCFLIETKKKKYLNNERNIQKNNSAGTFAPTPCFKSVIKKAKKG